MLKLKFCIYRLFQYFFSSTIMNLYLSIKRFHLSNYLPFLFDLLSNYLSLHKKSSLCVRKNLLQCIFCSPIVNLYLSIQLFQLSNYLTFLFILLSNYRSYCENRSCPEIFKLLICCQTVSIKQQV